MAELLILDQATMYASMDVLKQIKQEMVQGIDIVAKLHFTIKS